MVYLRFVAKPKEIYQVVESFYSDFRKLRIRHLNGSYGIMYLDEFADHLLREETLFGLALPRIPKRQHLEDSGQLGPRRSVLEAELEQQE